MKYSVQYSRTAVRDLERIWKEIMDASQNCEVTDNYINDLIDKVKAKVEYPESGVPLYYENHFTGYYYVVFKSYMALYQVKKDRMLVDRVLYGR